MKNGRLEKKMSSETIRIKGAREHNLKNIDVEIPRNKLVVLTGLSGSGKSSLAFDTIYAEGQRRYVESLSSYARQFLGQMDKPDVDYIEGLSPAISIDQKTTSKNPRSTVGTVTEVYDYLRLLYARIGIPHCHICGKPIARQSVDQIVDQIMLLEKGCKIVILAPVVRARKGEHAKVFSDARKAGYVRVRVDSNMYELTDDIVLEKNKKHNIELVIDRLIIREDISQRLTDSVETALKISDGVVIVDVIDGEEMIFSQNYACEKCGVSMDELSPRMFSFNSPFGACSECDGLGILKRIDPNLVIRNRKKSIRDGALAVSGWRAPDIDDSIASATYKALAKHYDFSLDTPFEDLSEKVQNILLYGTGREKIKIEYKRNFSSGIQLAEFEGLVNNLQRRYKETTSEWVRSEIEYYMSDCDCTACRGKRLKPEILAVTVGNKNIDEVTSMSISEEIKFFESLELSEREKKIAKQVLKEINDRLGFLKNVGLSYLTLSRSAGTLSGGEAQRIRLATQIGSSLMGVLYILDEPSIGLHQRDNEKLLSTLKKLRDLGNTLIVVEHDEDTMYAADHIIDIGPGAGVHGGEVVAQGDAEAVKKVVGSATGDYLSGRKKILVPEQRRKGNGEFLSVKGAHCNNLKNINVKIPLGVLTCVTGVSGKSDRSHVVL